MRPRQLARALAAKAAKALEAKSRELFNDSFEYLEQEARDVINSTTAFPANAPDDIVWSGRLRDSQRTARKRNSGQIVWNPRNPKNGHGYAPNVVSGFRAWGKGRWVPGRDWAGLALAKTQRAGGNINGRVVIGGGEVRLLVKRRNIRGRVNVKG
jgi:hypothetical protein